MVVRNNISLKKQTVESTGIGLRSIHSRYRILGEESPVIRKDEDYFAVIISLIASVEKSPQIRSKPISQAMSSSPGAVMDGESQAEISD